MITITIIMIVIMSSVRACINIFPDPKNEAALRRVALPLQADSFLVFLFLILVAWSDLGSPTGSQLVCASRHVVGQQLLKHPPDCAASKGQQPVLAQDSPTPCTRYGFQVELWQRCTDACPNILSSGQFPRSFLHFIYFSWKCVCRLLLVHLSVRLLVCSFGVLFVSLFICLFVFFSSCCLFSINIWHLSRHFPEPSRASRAFGAGTLSFQVFQQSLPYPFPLSHVVKLWLWHLPQVAEQF